MRISKETEAFIIGLIIGVVACLCTSCASQIKIVKTQPNEVRVAPKYYIDKNNNLLIYVPENGRFYNIKEKKK